MNYNGTKANFSTWLHSWLKKRYDMGILIEFRQYQEDMLWEIISGQRRRFVLSAAPVAGKTLMSIMYIDWCLYLNPNFRCIILTHGTKTLKTQYTCEVHRVSADFEHNENIQIGLPHGISKKVRKNILGKIDLIVVDEAHHFYFADGGMVEEIIKKLNPDAELLLTGSPDPFILRNKRTPDSFFISYITVGQLWDLGYVFRNIDLEVASTTYDFTIKDYTKTGELRESTSFPKSQIKTTVEEMLESIMKRIRTTLSPEKYKWFEMLAPSAQKIFLRKHVGKTMFVCHSIKMANVVAEFLRDDYGYSDENIMLSTSGPGGGDGDLTQFKEDPNVRFLIVVYRGILGFNYEDLENIVDLSGSRNVARNFQLYCREIRLSDNVKNKLYLKVVPKDMVYYFEKFMAGVLHLCDIRWISQFDGLNFDQLQLIPTDYVTKKKKKPGERVGPGPGDGPGPDYRMPADLRLETIFDLISLHHKGDKPIDGKAYTTISRVMDIIGMQTPNYKKYTDDDLREELKLWEKKLEDATF